MYFSRDKKQQLTLTTPGLSCEQSERQIEYEQEETSPCFENIRTQLEKLERIIEKVMKSLPGTQKEKSTSEKQKSTTIVQVYDRDGYLADDFMTAAKTWTRDQFKMMNVGAVSDIDKDRPVILLCRADSRLKADVDYASELITNLEDFRAAFVVIHMKEAFALPNISSKSVLCEDERYKNMHFIDAALTKEQKYYKCQMNADAARKLIDFLKTIGQASVETNYYMPTDFEIMCGYY